MKIIALIIFLLLIFGYALQPAHANSSAPQWIDESWRSASYPSFEWYTGFVKDNTKWQPNYQAIEKEALGKLSEGILIQVQGSANVQNTSRQFKNGGNSSETSSTNYTQSITTESNLALAKAEVKSYFDKNTGDIYGFAVVRKKDLANFYKSKIASMFSFADKEFALMKQLSEHGKKNTALGKIQAIEDSLKNIDSWGSLLQIVESDNSYLEKERVYWQKINNMKMQLQLSTSIHLEVFAKEFDGLGDRLAAQMQENGCNCVIAKSKENTNYAVIVKAKMETCIENRDAQNKTVYCYANASVTVNNSKYQKPVNVNIDAKGGWMNGNIEKAKGETFKNLVKSLAEKITQTINN